VLDKRLSQVLEAIDFLKNRLDCVNVDRSVQFDGRLSYLLKKIVRAPLRGEGAEPDPAHGTLMLLIKGFDSFNEVHCRKRPGRGRGCQDGPQGIRQRSQEGFVVAVNKRVVVADAGVELDSHTGVMVSLQSLIEFLPVSGRIL